MQSPLTSQHPLPHYPAPPLSNRTFFLHLTLVSTEAQNQLKLQKKLHLSSSSSTMTDTTPKVRVGVGVFILASRSEPPTNPSFLIGKRINSHGSGTFALPGGHLEFGETPEECAAREVLEETGLAVSDLRFLTATNDYMPDEGKHYVTLFMVCVRRNKGDEPQVLERDKCEGWEWACWEDLKGWVGSAERRLFLPLINLVGQRPGVIPSIL